MLVGFLTRQYLASGLLYLVALAVAVWGTELGLALFVALTFDAQTALRVRENLVSP